MWTLVTKIWIKLEVCLCTKPRGAWNKLCALFPASCVCNGPPKLRCWACQSASLWLCVAVAALKWFFWHVRHGPDSVRHVRARATVSHWQDQYHRVLWMQHVSVLNLNPQQYWQQGQRSTDHVLCLPHAVINTIRCHGRDLALGARTHARYSVRGQGTQGSGRGRNTWRSTGFSIRWVQWLVAGKVRTNRVSIAWRITVT